MIFDLRGVQGAEKDIAGDVELDIAAFATAVRAALPTPLDRQPIGRVLQRRCTALAAAGWTADQVADAVRGRGWDGAGVGALLSWLGDLRNECRTAKMYVLQSISSAPARGPDLVEEYRRALNSAAASDSPARAAALRLATAAASKARERPAHNKQPASGLAAPAQ